MNTRKPSFGTVVSLILAAVFAALWLHERTRVATPPGGTASVSQLPANQTRDRETAKPPAAHRPEPQTITNSPQKVHTLAEVEAQIREREAAFFSEHAKRSVERAANSTYNRFFDEIGLTEMQRQLMFENLEKVIVSNANSERSRIASEEARTAVLRTLYEFSPESVQAFKKVENERLALPDMAALKGTVPGLTEEKAALLHRKIGEHEAWSLPDISNPFLPPNTPTTDPSVAIAFKRSDQERLRKSANALLASIAGDGFTKEQIEAIASHYNARLDYIEGTIARTEEDKRDRALRGY